MAHEAGCADLFEKDDDSLSMTEAFYQSLHERFLEPYDEAVFWDELVRRLAMRDMLRMGVELKTSPSAAENLEEMAHFMEKYREEFEVNGLENVEVSTGRGGFDRSRN